jgi:lipopolysaccharide export LptBFGC system permease protein LptF
MLIGTILKFFIPENWAMWKGALLAGGLVGLIYWVLFKVGLTEKKVPIWLGVSLMTTGFFASIYLSNIYEKQNGSLFHW